METTTKSANRPSTQWQEEQEQILREWADKAMCFKWLHSKSHESFSYRHAMFTIPVIILSTITGTANFALERFDEDVKSIAVMFIGTLNIFTGILSTVAQFLKIAEINEGHRVASISWDKFYRVIKIELAKASKDRRSPKDLIRQCQEEYDRLVETSPSIQQRVIDRFNDLELSPAIQKPEICGTLLPITIHNSVADHVKEQAVAGVQQEIQSQLGVFKQEFFKLHGRYPTVSEMNTKFTPTFPTMSDDVSSPIGKVLNTVNNGMRSSAVAVSPSTRKIVMEDDDYENKERNKDYHEHDGNLGVDMMDTVIEGIIPGEREDDSS